MLGEGPTFGSNASIGLPAKKFSINFSKGNTKCCLSLHYNTHNSSFVRYRKEIFKFKANNKNVYFLLNFVSEVYLMNLVLLSPEKYLK